MFISIRQLRSIIRESLLEIGGTGPTKPIFNVGQNMRAPSRVDREQLGSLAQVDTDIVDELPSHLVEPQVDYKDCYGPVPPIVGEPLVMHDPFAKDISPIPSPQRYR